MENSKLQIVCPELDWDDGIFGGRALQRCRSASRCHRAPTKSKLELGCFAIRSSRWSAMSPPSMKAAPSGAPGTRAAKIALSLALVLATVSSALAGPKPARQQTTVQPQVLAGAHLGLDSVRSTSARSTGPSNQPSNISPRVFERLAHLIEDFDDIGFKEDSGN